MDVQNFRLLLFQFSGKININIDRDDEIERNKKDCCLSVRPSIYLLVYYDQEKLTGWLERLDDQSSNVFGISVIIVVPPDSEFPSDSDKQMVERFKKKLHFFKWISSNDSEGLYEIIIFFFIKKL